MRDIEKKREKTRQWFLDHPDYHKQYYEVNKERIQQEHKQWRQDNPDYDKQRYQDNKEAHKRSVKLRGQECADAGFCRTHHSRPAVIKGWCWECRLMQITGRRIRSGLKSQNVTKSLHTDVLLGCTYAEHRIYLENLFQPGMTWANMGRYGWHKDHIRPLSSFDLSDPEQQRLAFNYANTQPLWAKDNLEKSDKWDT